MNNRRGYFFIFMWVAGAFSLIALGAAIATAATNGFGVGNALIITFVAIVPAMFLVFYFFAARFYNQTKMNKSLEFENLYALGERMPLFNLYAFEQAVTLRTRFRRNAAKQQWIIAFSPSESAAGRGSRSNSEMSEVNRGIARILEKLFAKKGGEFDHYKHLFCFDRGTFLVYCFDRDEEQVYDLAVAIRDKIYAMVEERRYHIYIQPFFGIAEAGKDKTLIEAIGNATLARDTAESNFEAITYFDESMKKANAQSDTDEILAAFENHEFKVFYQPKFSLTKNRFVSSEALVRWESPTRGFLNPGKFMDKIEAAGLIHELDTYVFKQVCADLSDSKRRGRRLLPVSVNFSLYEFYSADFLSSVIKTIDDANIDHHLIEVEITETTSQANQFLSVSIIKKLRQQGIRILMDDFGIGYSNISNLRRIPFDAVKIDKSYIDNITTDERAREVVRLSIGLCKISGLEVVAEGVDAKEQVEILKKAHCDTIQGFYYSQALPKDKYERFLIDNPFEGEYEGGNAE